MLLSLLPWGWDMASHGWVIPLIRALSLLSLAKTVPAYALCSIIRRSERCVAQAEERAAQQRLDSTKADRDWALKAWK